MIAVLVLIGVALAGVIALAVWMGVFARHVYQDFQKVVDALYPIAYEFHQRRERNERRRAPRRQAEEVK